MNTQMDRQSAIFTYIFDRIGDLFEPLPLKKGPLRFVSRAGVAVTSVKWKTSDSCIFIMFTVAIAPAGILTVKNASFVSSTIQIIHKNGSISSAKVDMGPFFDDAVWVTKHLADNWGFSVIEIVVTNCPPVARATAHFNSSAVVLCRFGPTHQTDVKGTWGWWRK